MDIIARIIINYNYNYKKTIILRLCNKLYYTNTNNYIWTLNNFIKNCKYFLPYHAFTTIAVNETVQNKSISKNHYLFEHQIIHSYFENSVHYNGTIFPRIKTYAKVISKDINNLKITNWSNESANKIFKAIKKLTYYYLSDSKLLSLSIYDDILRGCIKQLTVLENQQIMILMQCLIVLNDVIKETSSYTKFMKELNKECLKRFYPSNTKKLLLMSDAFYQFQDKNSDFLFRAIRKLSSKNLSAKSLVQMLFYLNLTHIGSAINMFEIEYQVEQYMPDLVVNELGIIARSFFLQKRRIRNKTLLPLIMKKVSQNTNNLDSITLASIMKLIRYSDCVHCKEEFQILLKSLHDIIPNLSLKCLVHIAHAFGSLHVYDEILTNKIIERIITQIQNARLKDIERIIYSICTIAPNTNYYTDMYEKLIKEITTTYKTTRAYEIEIFPTTLVRILTFLTMKNIYIPELIQYIFEPNFMQKIYKNNLKLITNEWLVLHCSVKIELPYYQGPMLNNNMYKYLTKKFYYNDDVYRKDNIIKLKTEIVDLCKTKLGINVYVDYILPHYPNREIIFGMDKYNNFVDIEYILSEMETNTIKSVKNKLENISWKILFILSNLGNVLGHNDYNGYIQRQVRQLKTIGYEPILINQNEWILYSQDEKIEYLKQL
ncbi:uncharacterized protein LOC113218594, partial [Apis mellifera]|uniref:Uncharacterized protein LOC113218594 n=1 Tax=Apis mellifera TaxID=7460 RepID=A0A7M7L1B4_APIME